MILQTNCTSSKNSSSLPFNRIIDETRVHALTSAEPFELCDIKQHLLIDGEDYDFYLNSLMVAAREALENFCAISIRQKSVKLLADLYRPTELPYGPTAEIASVKRKTSTATFEAVTVNTDYTYDFADTISFGQFEVFTPGRYKIEYKAGWLATTVPTDLLLDLKRIIVYLFENRGDESGARGSSFYATDSMDKALALFAGKYRRMQWV